MLFICVGLGTATPEVEDVGEVLVVVDVELGAGFWLVVPMQ